MKIKSRSKVLAVPILMLGAYSANAATDMDAVQACSDAIATFVEEKQGAPLKVSVDLSTSGLGRRLSEPTVFHLDATDPTTGDVVGRYDCHVNRRGIVRSLRELSPNMLAARTRVET